MSNTNNKFLFDLNKFDEPDEPEIEEVLIEEEIEPPPPTFSEDELEAAKAVAFTKGKSEGIQEERAKREQELTDILGAISENFSTIFASEVYREKAYEQEAIKLALQIVELLAPVLQDKLGDEALKETIVNSILAQTKQSEIIIEVAESVKDEITVLLEKLSEQNENSPRFKVKGRDDLTSGSCELSWKDGGMVRNPLKTAADIQNALMELLNDTKETVPSSANNDINNKTDSNDTVPLAETPQPETGDNHD